MNRYFAPVWRIGAALTLLGTFAALGAPAEKSPFAIRGTLPWHNFLSGPSAWNEADYDRYLDDLAAKGLNFVGFHCYTGGAERYAPYVEPIVRFAYRDVVPEATFDTSLTCRWGYRPLPIHDFAFGTAKYFPLESGADVFGAACAIGSRSREEHYRQSHELMGRVVQKAKERGIQVAMGFEFGVHPPEFASIVPPESRIAGAMLPDPMHPANVEILQSGLQDILDSYPGVSWIWLWLHEHSMFVAKPVLGGAFLDFYEREKNHFSDANAEHDVFTGVWSLAHIRQAHAFLARKSPQTRLVIGGWGGGPQLPPVLRGLDRALPTNIVFSCLNADMGELGHAPVLQEIAGHREVWSMPWLEGDSALWHLQFRAGSMLRQVKSAHAGKLAGVVAIHWRTEEILPNLEAFARAAANPNEAPTAATFYQEHARQRYGPEAAAYAGTLLYQFEQEKQLGNLSSPEFYPYSPSWGRISPALREQLEKSERTLRSLAEKTAEPASRDNLEWLADKLRFTVLLDEVGRALQPAYELKDRVFQESFSPQQLRDSLPTASASLQAAPMRELFETFSRRARSRGELGELSALNQKVWLQYRELERFLEQSTKR